MKFEEIVIRLKTGDPISLAKAITIVENRKNDYRQLLAALYPIEKRSLKIGVTGSPGSGKSSLIEKIVSHLRKRNLSVAVLAVDPSSPITGGALLGDRIRMTGLSNDSAVFIRSIASRGHLGGLSDSTLEIIQLFEAAGKDVILIETVGVGQSEVEIACAADMVLTVLTPAGGDEIQIFKAGIIEVTDIFVINKADLEGAETKIAEIGSYFSTAEKPPIVFPVSARTGEGIGALTDAVLDFAHSHKKRAIDRKKTFQRNLVLKLTLQKISERIGDDGELRRLLETEESGNPITTAEELFARLTKGGIGGQKDPAHRHRGTKSG